MCEVPVFYATTEGQTRRIAERLAQHLRAHGLESEPIALAGRDAAAVDWSRVRGAALGASLHMQKHQREAVAFARAHGRELSAVPSLFFSVSLSAHSKDPAEVQAGQRLAEKFAADTGWQPARIASVAGRLAYTQYNFFVRFLMRRIALKEGGSGDTSRDHEYTDWPQVEQLARELADRVLQRGISPVPAKTSVTRAS